MLSTELLSVSIFCVSVCQYLLCVCLYATHATQDGFGKSTHASMYVRVKAAQGQVIDPGARPEGECLSCVACEACEACVSTVSLV